jgi:hypothetical protein
MNITLNNQDIVNAIAYYLKHVKSMEMDSVILSSKNEFRFVGAGVFNDEYEIKQIITAQVKIK